MADGRDESGCVVRPAYRRGYSAAVPAAVVHNELEAIRTRDGIITAAAVVNEARAVSSPLHPVFNWNNSEAAELWRRTEASKLIRNVVYVRVGPQTVRPPTLAYVHVPTRDAGGRDSPGYQAVAVIRENPAAAHAVALDALRALEGWARRFRYLSDDLGGLPDEMLDRVARLRAELLGDE